MTPQSLVGHYRIIAKLGEGGMGEVWRATDTQLGRDVAIKILPPALALDAQYMARFEREAQTLAALNHPNIATIYGVEQGAIVMELVEGETLPCPVPVPTALAYARQIAEGLEAAHEKGIVHRDLKPANIRVTPEGRIKILDFGLAKAPALAAEAAAASVSPTLSLSMTQAGMILGTAGYMAPEQARGKLVDKRADIWAYGVVLFEMLTGKPLFGGGETVTDIIAAVVTRDPDWSLLPGDTPPHVRRLVERCLRKDPQSRMRDIGEARLAIDQPDAPPAAATPPVIAKRARLPWIVAAVGLAAGAAGLSIVALQPVPAPVVKARFTLEMPDGHTTWGGAGAPNVVPSPDGKSIVFLAADSEGKSALWLRPTDSTVSRQLDRTEGATHPFWSPDSQFVAFFADGKLKKLSVSGGAALTICDVSLAESQRSPSGGGTWSASGVIVFAATRQSALLRVPAAGGSPEPLWPLDQKIAEVYQSWPQFLPDGHHLLYYAAFKDPKDNAIFVQDLGSSQRTLVLKTQVRGMWSPPGYLLLPREGILFAQRINPKTFQLSGEAMALAEDVNVSPVTGSAGFSASDSGIIAYRSGSTIRPGQLTWYSRDGKALGAIGKPEELTSIALSPDGKSVALSIGAVKHSDVWIMDIGTGVLTRMTGDGRGSQNLGPWSPDSRRLAIDTETGLLELTVASGKTRLLAPLGLKPLSWSPDDRSLLCLDPARRLVTLGLEPDARAVPVADAPPFVDTARLSPDGKFVAYAVARAGVVSQVFVASFPSFSEKRQISKDGGTYPIWRHDGKELFFRTPDGRVVAQEIRLGAKIEVGAQKPLFAYAAGPVGATYSVTGDGQRFLVKDAARRETVSPVYILLNWAAGLKP
jgi:eukaryotic-like serine/threonine-protein kinase